MSVVVSLWNGEFGVGMFLSSVGGNEWSAEAENRGHRIRLTRWTTIGIGIGIGTGTGTAARSESNQGQSATDTNQTYQIQYNVTRCDAGDSTVNGETIRISGISLKPTRRLIYTCWLVCFMLLQSILHGTSIIPSILYHPIPYDFLQCRSHPPPLPWSLLLPPRLRPIFGIRLNIFSLNPFVRVPAMISYDVWVKHSISFNSIRLIISSGLLILGVVQVNWHSNWRAISLQLSQYKVVTQVTTCWRRRAVKFTN